MTIKNKFLRFITSVFITLVIYFLFALSFEGNPVEIMVLFAVFGLFFVIPFLSFMVYVFYVLLTKKEERPESTSIKKITLFLIIIALLYLSTQFTYLFNE